MFSVTVFAVIALFHLLDMSDSKSKHAGSNSSEPFIQMAQTTQQQLWGNGYRQEHPQKQKWEPFQQMKQAIENCGVGGILDSQTEWLSEVSHGKRSEEEVIIGKDVNGKIT